MLPLHKKGKQDTIYIVAGSLMNHVFYYPYLHIVPSHTESKFAIWFKPVECRESNTVPVPSLSITRACVSIILQLKKGGGDSEMFFANK